MAQVDSQTGSELMQNARANRDGLGTHLGNILVSFLIHFCKHKIVSFSNNFDGLGGISPELWFFDAIWQYLATSRGAGQSWTVSTAVSGSLGQYPRHLAIWRYLKASGGIWRYQAASASEAG